VTAMEALDALHTPQRPSPARHPSTGIPADVVEELNFRSYLSQLEPPMTVEQSAQSEYRFTGNNGKLVTQNDDSRRMAAKSLLPKTRDFLRIAVDMRLIDCGGGQ